MNSVECSREQDVLDALTTGQWPERADETLRTHVAACAICTDLVSVVCPILDARETAVDAARIPSSAVMWWRAQMRARREATREAARPITVAQVMGVAAMIALAVGLGIVLFPVLRGWTGGPESVVGLSALEGMRLHVPEALVAQGWWLPALAISFWLILAPLAIYFVVADD